MPLLTRDQVKSIVLDALEKVADLPADPESAPFNQMQDEHKQVFLDWLKQLLNGYPYPDDNGAGRYYDVPLSLDLLNGWATVKDCIDYIFENQAVAYPD